MRTALPLLGDLNTHPGVRKKENFKLSHESKIIYNGSAHRRSHHRGPPYRDSAIAWPPPMHRHFSLNSQFTGVSTQSQAPWGGGGGGAPGLYSSARPGRQYTPRVPPEYPAGAAHLKLLPRVAHLRAARPQARGDEEPTGKLPAGRQAP